MPRLRDHRARYICWMKMFLLILVGDKRWQRMRPTHGNHCLELLKSYFMISQTRGCVISLKNHKSQLDGIAVPLFTNRETAMLSCHNTPGVVQPKSYQPTQSKAFESSEIHFLPPGESPVVTLFTQIWRGDDTVDTADDTKVHCSWHGGPKLFPNCPQFTALSPIEVPGRIPHMETLMKDTESRTHKWDTLSHNQPDLSSVFIHNKASDGIPNLL